MILLQAQDAPHRISQGRAVLVLGRDGTIDPSRREGLFSHQTRFLCLYRYRIDDQPPLVVALSNVQQHSWLGYYIASPPGIQETGKDESNPAQQTLELRTSRTIGGGLHEDLDLTNHSQITTSFTLTLDLDADFADPQEIGADRMQQGHITRRFRQVAPHHWEQRWDHVVEHQQVRLSYALVLTLTAPTAPRRLGREISWRITLPPRGTWHACLSFAPVIDGRAHPPQHSCYDLDGFHTQADRSRRVFLSEATAFSTPLSGSLSHAVVETLEQAKYDLSSLRMDDLDQGPRAWTMAAGLPAYMALFGRDTLTASWQAALLGPEMMAGTLPELARWQGRVDDPWRDESPGKMLHEAQTSPLARLGYHPFGRYYGSLTTSAFYPVVVAELFHWTGNQELIRPLVDPALAGLAWLDQHAKDGHFYFYQTRSEQGLKNQAWKDSNDAMVHEDGSQAQTPIATCEEQAFVYAAKQFLATVLWWLGDKDTALHLLRNAHELKQRFNAAYWMEDLNFFALGLDRHHRSIRSIGSNPGHCLAAGIVDASLVRPTAARLLAKDLFSGWGIRTLSSQHPAYNPFSYHRGTVWPVEQGTFALGFMRHGFHGHVHTLARALFECAGLFPHHRLPECLGGHQRDALHPFPALYPFANAPQAWSASSIFCLLQAMLGLYPYAPLGLLFVDPHLPDWLPELTLHGLRVGQARTTLHFFRRPDGISDYHVLELDGPLRVLRQASPWSLSATAGERVVDLFSSFLPHRP